MKIVVDVEKCMGSGQCVRLAPRVFAQDDVTGLVRLLTDEPSAEDQEAVELAIEACPVIAISKV